VEQDGAKYCDALTQNLMEQITGAKGARAKTKCEQLVKKGNPKLPLRVTIKPGAATKTTAKATLVVSAPRGPIMLRKQAGGFKIDQAQPSAASKPPPKPKKPKQPK